MDQRIYINNRYQLIEKLGQGGMGAVYKAYDRLEKQHVALKQVLLSPQSLQFASKPGTNDSEKLRLSLAREFRILATLRHPHILSVLDFGFDGDKQPFYTMTLLEGATDAKTYGINLSNSRRIVLMGQMLQALHYLHRRGVLHRDLKPDNVFVTPDEQVKVMDFGLAKLDTVVSDTSGSVAGTISYMAPELFQGTRASVTSDLFAVGVMVYEIMVGQHPFAANTFAERMLIEHYRDVKTFNAPYGVRTLSKMEKMYNIRASGNPSCWLGPIWGISNYMSFRALLRYGFLQDAQLLAEKTVLLFGRDVERFGSTHEYYQPENGEPILNWGFQNCNYLVLNMIAWLEQREVMEEF